MRALIVLALSIAVPGVGWAEPNRSALADPLATSQAVQTRIAEGNTEEAQETPLPNNSGIPSAIPGDVEAGPFPLGGGVQVDYYYLHPNKDDGRRLFGTITNTSEFAVTSPPLRFTLFDADGNILDTVGTTPLYEWLAPGETMPFMGFMSESQTAALDDWDSETVEACFGVTPADLEDDPVGIELRDVEEIERDGNRIQIVGQVFNARESGAFPVKVSAAFFDPEGRYVGDLSDYLTVTIPAQRSARFTIDHGYALFHSFNPINYAEDSDVTYVLSAGIGGNVTIGCS